MTKQDPSREGLTPEDINTRLAFLLEELCSGEPLSEDLQRRCNALPDHGPPRTVRAIDAPILTLGDIESLIRDGVSSIPSGVAYDALVRLQKAHAVQILERPAMGLMHHADIVTITKGRVRLLASCGLLHPIIVGPTGVLDFLESTLHRVSFVQDGTEQSITAAVVRLPGEGDWSYLVTCAHGFDDDCSKHALAEPNDSLEELVNWASGRRDPLNDIWAVHIPGYHGPALTPRFDRAPVLTELTLAGYPYVSNVHRHVCTFHRGELAAQTSMQSGREIFLHTASNYPGNSGGPLVDSLGFLVGVSTENFVDSTVPRDSSRILRLPFHVATPTGALLSLIKTTSQANSN